MGKNNTPLIHLEGNPTEKFIQEKIIKRCI